MFSWTWWPITSFTKLRKRPEVSCVVPSTLWMFNKQKLLEIPWQPWTQNVWFSAYFMSTHNSRWYSFTLHNCICKDFWHFKILLCVYMCVHVDVCICAYVCVYLFMGMCASMWYVSMCVYVYVCVHVYVFMCVCLCMCVWCAHAHGCPRKPIKGNQLIVKFWSSARTARAVNSLVIPQVHFWHFYMDKK